MEETVMSGPNESSVRPADEETVQALASSVRLDAPTLEQVRNAIIGRTATAAAAAVRELYAPVVAARAVPTVGQWCEYFHPALEDVTRERDEARAALARVEALAREQWRTIPVDLPEQTAAAYAKGRNDFINALRIALRGDAEEANGYERLAQDRCDGSEPTLRMTDKGATS